VAFIQAGLDRTRSRHLFFAFDRARQGRLAFQFLTFKNL
jgi:hypothetical protein